MGYNGEHIPYRKRVPVKLKICFEPFMVPIQNNQVALDKNERLELPFLEAFKLMLVDHYFEKLSAEKSVRDGWYRVGFHMNLIHLFMTYEHIFSLDEI